MVTLHLAVEADARQPGQVPLVPEGPFVPDKLVPVRVDFLGLLHEIVKQLA